MSSIDVGCSSESLQLFVESRANGLSCLGNSYGDRFGQQLRSNPVSVLEVSLSDKRCPGGALSTSLLANFIYIPFIYVYVLGSFYYYIRFL